MTQFLTRRTSPHGATHIHKVMYYNFANKVAIVTGGISGIGLSTTIKLLRSGAKVVIGDYKHESEIDTTLNYLRDEVPENHNFKFLRTDVSSYQDNINLVDFTLDQYKDLDYAVANAASSEKLIPGADDSFELFAKSIDVNLNSVFSLNQLAINYWEEFNRTGSIVNVSSILGIVGTNCLASHCAAKGGVNLLTKALALDYAKKGIRINSVCPGYIHTPLLENSNLDVDELIEKHPIGRLGKPNEIANAIAFLLSDEASFITGTSLVVDGGYTAQ